MRRIVMLAALVTFGTAGAASAEEADDDTRAVAEGRREAGARPRFLPLDVWADSGEAPLAAYQVEVTYDGTGVKIVGIEGGETAAFNPAPYYDGRGMSGGRIVIAAFVAEGVDEKDAPKGRTRVARLHLRVEGGGAPDCSVRLVTAARPGGGRIEPEVGLVETSRATAAQSATEDTEVTEEAGP
jgi:hypothetical protein